LSRVLPERGVPTPLSLYKMTGLYKLFPRVKVLGNAQQLAENETGKVDILVGALCL
jgi:hypothetical protein